MKVAYVVSSSFSGSTLLSFLLNAHPAIGTISEFDTMENIVHDPDFRCSCGERIRQCPFFAALKTKLRERSVPFEVDDMGMMLTLHRHPRINRLLSEKLPYFQSTGLERFRDKLVTLVPHVRREKTRINHRTEAFMQAILELQRATIFLDATKNPYRMRFLSEQHDVRAIYIFKNGIAGVYSFVKNSANTNAPMSVEKASHRWFTEQLTISRLLKTLGRKCSVQLAYSELCRDTTGSMAKIYDLLGVELHPLTHYADAPHHIVGNIMRMGSFSEIRESTDWKERMSPAEVEVYRSVYRQYEKRLADANKELLSHIWR